MRKVKTATAENMRDTRKRVAGLAAVVQGMGDWRPRAEVITDVEAVPTIFCQYDHAVRIGGNPVGRVVVVHGPSNEGKTIFGLGLGLSYLQRGHAFGLVDVERTTTAKWVQTLMGSLADDPAFAVLPGKSYEHVREQVRVYCERIGEAREKGSIPKDTTGLVVVDSLQRLVPERLWANLTKEIDQPKTKKKGMDGMGGRAGQYKAALNAQWLAELVPLLADTRMSILLISREKTEESSDIFTPDKHDPTGGVAVKYDASLLLRISREFVMKGGKKADGDDKPAKKEMIGERHCVEVRKTKVAGKSQKVPRAYFHTSNGAWVPEGFDRARDVLELATELGVVAQEGSVRWGKTVLGRGEDAAVKKLAAEPATLRELESEVRAVTAP